MGGGPKRRKKSSPGLKRLLKTKRKTKDLDQVRGGRACERATLRYIEVYFSRGFVCVVTYICVVFARDYDFQVIIMP